MLAVFGVVGTKDECTELSEYVECELGESDSLEYPLSLLKAKPSPLYPGVPY